MWRGEEAGAPEGDHAVQAGDDADEEGENQGVQRRDQAGFGGQTVGLRAQLGQEAGDARVQGGWGTD